jgi:hypothetical protein
MSHVPSKVRKFNVVDDLRSTRAQAVAAMYVTGSPIEAMMASNANDEVSRPILFTTETRYPLPSQNFMIPSSWKRYQLSQLINKALSLPKPVPFDFLVRGEILRTSLGEWCTEKGIGDVRVCDVWLYSD